ncbi:Hydroxyacylglutathione hydrolase [Methyloligella halotolerans]|uniref:Hydroxyacylglutathione hydrolase n=1 Tax=Methyloligella halotolerans TaxID=1177755 RepID=A0A1E2RVJ3_9HYPH|nr:hydroxyacylglutathione hydrolase [Methyloligella halotolerans]ODA66254.1 Hydroxyacylglutathione hydrolase [Methyloligella halotolerans]
MEIYQFPTRGDNFGVLLHDPETEATAAIDAPDAEDVRKALSEKGWILTHILVTHHHHDHTAGIVALKKASGCIVVGPAAEQETIPGIDIAVKEGDTVEAGNMKAEVIETPGHTAGHITYFFPDEPAAFVGDTIFSIGCGKLMEGNAQTMWSSLQKIMELPPETAIYCGHEYTQANARFALTIEPENETLQARAKQVEELRRQGKATLPTTLAQELATNPFLRPDSPAIQERLGMTGKPLDEVFGEIRHRKDVF